VPASWAEPGAPMQLYPDSLVYLFCDLFGEEWVEKPSDALFGRIPIDARFVEPALVPERRVTEKSVGEQMAVACVLWLAQNGYFELSVAEERGWNFETYEKVFCLRRQPLPDSPLFARFGLAFESELNSIWLRRKRRAATMGVSCDRLALSLRRFRWFRNDPYRYACDLVRQRLVSAGLYSVGSERIAGPFLRPVLKLDPEKVRPFEPQARALATGMGEFAVHHPELHAVVRDNITRTMLKMRCDEEYMSSRESDEAASGDSPI